MKEIKTKLSKFECPECGYREMPHIYRQIEENIPTEKVWCYCLRCGVMFAMLQEMVAV